jgi:hypothetical protein
LDRRPRRGRLLRPVKQPRDARPGAGGGYRNPFGGVGSVYGMLGPPAPPPFQPEWQTYDITLIARWVTVVFNGVTTIDNQEIAGVTGGALDSHESEPAQSTCRATITAASAIGI